MSYQRKKEGRNATSFISINTFRRINLVEKKTVEKGTDYFIRRELEIIEKTKFIQEEGIEA